MGLCIISSVKKDPRELYDVGYTEIWKTNNNFVWVLTWRMVCVKPHVTFKWNIDIQALRVHLCLLGHCSHLTGFASSCSVARSVHPLYNQYAIIINSRWLPCDHVIVASYADDSAHTNQLNTTYSLPSHIQLSPTHTIPIWGMCPPQWPMYTHCYLSVTWDIT